MSHNDEDARLDQRLLVMRLILGALAVGITGFLIVVVFIRASGGAKPPANFPLITYIGLGWALLLLPVQALFPRLIVDRAARGRALAQGTPLGPNAASPPLSERGAWYAVYQTRLIIGAAILEGGAFFLLIAYFLEGALPGLAGALVLLAVLITKFPSRTRVDSWIDQQQELIQQQRMSG